MWFKNEVQIICVHSKFMCKNICVAHQTKTCSTKQISSDVCFTLSVSN